MLKQFPIAVLITCIIYGCSNDASDIETKTEVENSQDSILTKNEKVESTTLVNKDLNVRQSFTLKFAEWEGDETDVSCDVVIIGDSIKVYNDGSIPGKIGKIMEEGIIRIHTSSGKTIISHDSKDVNSKEIGGCSDGPTVIDLKKKIIWFC